MILPQLTDIFLPAIMAIFLAYIAYQQMRTNKNKLKLDQYNKRFEVYMNALKFYQELSLHSEVSKNTRIQFIKSKEASMFLFSKDPSIYKFLDEMHSESFKITEFKKHRKEHLCNTGQFMNSYDKAQETRQWLSEQIPLLRTKMQTFLNL